ncbi:MAG: hypothetical protein Q7T70_09165 [Polaromonas sp.]|nr:hypothetical protein [Polaromonas sp.]
MLHPIQIAQKSKGFPSFDATAKALINQFPDNDWGLKPRSLATLIGKLDRGEATWWVNHLAVAEGLAALLDLSLDDLGLHGGTSGSHVFKFPELPALKPLHLKREKPWKIGTAEPDAQPRDSGLGKPTLEEWLDPAPTAWRAPYGVHWLHVADALERRLLTLHLAASSRYKVVLTHTLADASAQLQDVKPLILVVASDVSEEDVKALGLRPLDTGLLVIAPNAMPSRHETSSMEYLSWERFNLQGAERRMFDLTTAGQMGDIKRWTWILRPDWRAEVLKWVEKRLNNHQADTLFDAQRMSHWLESFDPLGRWFETTADLLHLCEIGHLNSEKKLPKPHDLAAGSKLTQLLFNDKSSQRSDQIKQLADARWNRLDLAWQGDLPMEAWLSLQPASDLPPSAEEVLAIASAKTASERKKAAARVIGLLDQGNPAALRASGFLKESATGQFDFEHRTLVRLIVRDKLMRQIANESASSWALACFDADRRPLVDAALDAISLDALVRAAERLLPELAGGADSAGALGVSEALFIAIGRRIANRDVIDEKFLPVLIQLAERIVSQLDFTSGEYLLPAPWSRPMQLPEQRLTWLSACWAWSLHVTAPMAKPPDNWLFPGWSESLPEPPEWLNSLWPEEGVEQVSSAWKYFFKVADEWVKNWDQPMTNAPRILRMALLGRAAHGAWAADPVWWEDLIKGVREWPEEILLAQFKLAGKGVAARLWPSYLSFEKGFDARWRDYVVRLSRIRFWLLAQLSPVEGLADLTLGDLHYLASCPESLPPAFRAPLLRMAGLENRIESILEITPFLRRFGPAVTPVLPELLPHIYLGGVAAQCLWDWDSTEAERLLCHDETLGLEARSHLFHACPASKVGEAAAVLLERPHWFHPGEGLVWAQGHLPTAGSSAQALVKIIKRALTADGTDKAADQPG